MKGKQLSLIAGAIATVSLAVALGSFAPTALGGPVTYVTVTGSSMEPGLSAGDLVLARERGAYEAGDVVVFRHGDLGLVIHRIIGREGASFVLQGDNNGFIDGEKPGQAEIAGEKWLTVPGAGRWLAYIQDPLTLGALVFVAALAVLWDGDPRPKRRDRASAKRAGVGAGAGTRP